MRGRMSGFAADDAAAIAKRLKELEEEKREAIANLPSDLPSDVEPGPTALVVLSEPALDDYPTFTLDDFWAMVRRSGFLGDA